MPRIRVEKRGNYWQYIFEAVKIDDKRKRFSKGGFPTKSAAIDAGTQAKAEYDNSGFIINSTNLSISDYLNLWIEQYCKTNLKDTTTIAYEKKLRLYILPEIGHYKLNSITPLILQTLMTKCFNDGLSRNTLLCIKGILSSSFKYAIFPLHFIKTSPMEHINLPSSNLIPQKQPKTKVKDVITKKEFDIIIQRFPFGTSQYIPLQLGYRCGLRLGEAFAIDMKNDFNEENKTLTINYQVQNKNKTWYLSYPKYNSKRVIDLDDQVFTAIKSKKEQIEKDKIYFGNLYTTLYKDKNNNIVTDFTDGCIEFNPLSRNSDGTYCQPRVMQHCGRIVHYQLNMLNWDFHSLRHTHTSNLLSAGADIKYVQERLGHKNIQTTLNIYAHITNEMRDKNKSILNLI